MGGVEELASDGKGQGGIGERRSEGDDAEGLHPVGAPTLMFYPVANTITVQRDRVVMKVDWMESERTIFLDGRRHPPAGQTFLHGHSVGRWEGDTLVVETTNFTDHPMGLTTTFPSSTQKRLTERFRLGEDGKSLIYSGVVEDPVFLTRPVEWSGQWLQAEHASLEREVRSRGGPQVPEGFSDKRANQPQSPNSQPPSGATPPRAVEACGTDGNLDFERRARL